MQGLSPTTAASAAAFRAAHSSRRLQRTWRRFAAQRKTTAQLARTFAAVGITSLDSSDGGADAAFTDGASAADASSAAGAARERRRSSTPGVVMIGGLSAGRTSPHHMKFEDFAAKLQSPDTLKAAQVRGGALHPGCGRPWHYFGNAPCMHVLTFHLTSSLLRFQATKTLFIWVTVTPPYT